MMMRSESLQAAGHLIEIFIVGFEAGDALPALQKSIDRAKRFANNFLHAHEAAANALFRELKDRRFSIAENFFGRIGLIGGAGDCGVGCVNQSAQQGFVADDLDIVLDAGTIRNSVREAGNVADVANGLQIFVALEFFGQSNEVDGTGRLGEIDHASVDAAVRVERKIFDAQVLGSLVVGEVIEQDCAENGALGFYVRRKSADGVVGGGHAA